MRRSSVSVASSSEVTPVAAKTQVGGNNATKPADPNQLLAKFRLEVKAALYAAKNIRFNEAAAASAEAMRAAAALDEFLSAGGTLPAAWLNQPEFNLNNYWVDVDGALDCCLKGLLEVMNDPELNQDGKFIKCRTCNTHLVHKDGVWKWGLPPARLLESVDQTRMVRLSDLAHYVHESDAAVTPTED